MSEVPLATQAPVHPRNRCFFAGFAVSVTLVPTANDLEQCLPHLIPFGVLPTEPLPVMARASVYCCVGGTNVAVTKRAAVIMRLHEPMPVQSPPQPVKTLPPVGEADRETDVPRSTDWSRCGQAARPENPVHDAVLAWLGTRASADS